MAELDREHLISLLRDLGAEDDGEALAAARALHREAEGHDWDDLIRPQAELAAAAPADDVADPPVGETADAGLASVRDGGDDRRLIAQLAARDGISEDMRQELKLLERDLEGGEFTEMDRAYLRSLAKRLDGKPGG